MSGMIAEIPIAKLPEAPGKQYQATGLLIQELLKSVKSFQTSLENISANVDRFGI